MSLSIQIHRVTSGHYRPERGWQPGSVSGVVDGYRVRFTRSRGWECRCHYSECDHIASIAALIDPAVFTAITRGRADQ